MDAQLLKLADLTIDHTYYVLGYKPINTKFGDTYIIRCTHLLNDDEFEMFATKLIASYISEYSPKDKFSFTVRKNSKYTYAQISGYNPGSSYI
jgi:hypothetical protein